MNLRPFDDVRVRYMVGEGNGAADWIAKHIRTSHSTILWKGNFLTEFCNLITSYIEGTLCLLLLIN